MKVLLIGGGGREHALAFAIAKSPHLQRLFVAPGNPGTAELADNIPLDVSDQGAVASFCRKTGIDLVVVGPEAPLVAGMVDRLGAEGIKAFGPSRAAAALEGSKGFAKDLCRASGIPTADYARFDERAAALAYVRAKGAPIVVKADGLAAGKGVVVAGRLDEAEAAIDAMFAGGLARSGVVVEEFLEGEEVSLFALCDGVRAVPLGAAKDHKRVGDGDTGPNTGGMGAYSPSASMTAGVTDRVMREIVDPTLRAMQRRGARFKGLLYAGLMLTEGGPKLIEYNVRFGDPECQVLMLRLRDDLLPFLLACADGRLPSEPPRLDQRAALTVVMAARNYPGKPQVGTEIRGLDEARRVPGVTIFHAGTRRDGARLLADGGRVLNVSAVAATLAEARSLTYAAVDRIDWPDGFCRRDIGLRVENGASD